MKQCIEVCLVSLCVGMCVGLPCKDPHVSNLKFSVVSIRNSTGHWIAKMQLANDRDNKLGDPIELTMDHQTKKCKDQEEISINVTAVMSPKKKVTEQVQKAHRKLKEYPGPGFEISQGYGYYNIHYTAAVQSWQNASKLCESKGGHLLVLNSGQEADAVSALIARGPRPDYWYWIGFHDQYEEGNYVTIFNETLEEAGYTRWELYNLSRKESLTNDCGLFKRDFGMREGACNSFNTPFICENPVYDD